MDEGEGEGHVRPSLSSDRQDDVCASRDGLRTLLFGALLGVAVAGPATSRLGAEQEPRWGGAEVGVDLVLGLGRGRLDDVVRAAGGFGGYGRLPLPLDGGLACRAGRPA